MAFRGAWILFAFIVVPSVCVAEVSCDPRIPMATWDTKESIDRETMAEIRKLSDRYTQLWLSEHFLETKQYWLTARDELYDKLHLPFGIGAELRKDIALEWTQFERAFAVNEAAGKNGYYVVTEYGSRTSKFDVLHGMIWEPTESGWKVLYAYYTLRCGPESVPVKLSPNNALHLHSS